MRTRIMYIEDKSSGLIGWGRIGRVVISHKGKRITYGDQVFRSLNGRGYKANFEDVETGQTYWISGPKKRGGDRLYGAPGVEIDEDVRVEYWTTIRNQPENAHKTTT